ncbi:MAG: SGNH/GDSL hydrolase family protein, partial [Myxococcales bacterium]|nr:SGNH/GDSL hydrolase family protein [Myxococcales bacterium]
YGAFLAETRPGSSIDNLCKAGYNTYHAMPTGTQNPPGMPAVDPAKNITAAIALAPDAIIVSFPAADASSNVAEIMSNLHVIEATAAAASIPVWVSTPQPNEQMTPGDLANKLALRSNVIGDFGTHALDFWAPLVGPNDSWDPTKGLTDGVHPNALGHQLLFDVVVSSDIPGALGL